MVRCKGHDVLRNEAGLIVRRSDEGRVQRRRGPFIDSLPGGCFCPFSWYKKSLNLGLETGAGVWD